MVSIRQIKAARALLGWSQQDLASHSGISYPTIARLEAKEGELGGSENSRVGLVATLNRHVAFINENDGLGVKLKRAKGE